MEYLSLIQLGGIVLRMSLPFSPHQLVPFSKSTGSRSYATDTSSQVYRYPSSKIYSSTII